jgi:hypothetical protein
VAEADSFRPFAPNVKRQKVLHYTRYAWAARAAFAFDPARPTSLLYRREPDGSLKPRPRLARRARQHGAALDRAVAPAHERVYPAARAACPVERDA